MERKDKKSFIIYSDLLDSIEMMTDEEAGKMLRAIKAYWGDEEYDLPRELKFAFLPIKQHFDRDWQAYVSQADKNRINGKKGGRPKDNPKNPSGYSDNPKKPDNDNDNDNGNVKDKDKDKKTPLAMLADMGVDESLAKEWLAVRKLKKLAATQTAFNGVRREAGKASITMNDAVKKAVEESWGGFKAEWLTNQSLKRDKDFENTDYTVGIEGFNS